jgi:hypothetical protein
MFSHKKLHAAEKEAQRLQHAASAADKARKMEQYPSRLDGDADPIRLESAPQEARGESQETREGKGQEACRGSRGSRRRIAVAQQYRPSC